MGNYSGDGNLSKIVIFKAEATIIWSVAPITRMYE